MQTDFAYAFALARRGHEENEIRHRPVIGENKLG